MKEEIAVNVLKCFRYDTESDGDDVISYALRAIEERRELLAALKAAVKRDPFEDGGNVALDEETDALIAKCEAP